MLCRRIATVSKTQCRFLASDHGPRPVPVPTLRDASLDTFRIEAFDAATPARLPLKHFRDLPAAQKWFTRGEYSKSRTFILNTAYLSRFGATIVPLEISNADRFARIEQSLSFFLECVQASTSRYNTKASRNRYFSSYVPGARAMRKTATSNDFFTSASSTSSPSLSTPTAQVYLAQAPIADLPRALAQDVPTPELVLKAGKGDIYGSSIWLGQAPTYTPLHRDPNPNLFVQLAGRKIVRLCRPEVGQGIFAKVQERIGGTASATMRGEEMMQGSEKKALEDEVWSESDDGTNQVVWETELRSGDALFIPKGWWHSVKGIGHGMTGSVNWWFR
ncbi:Hypothetical predicted protein [Lecanosticta acicola]|uniref:JmjC domain-containing protein n=1 Tax=Lecanosticta acicola TaxID=111012 RepID=A0AAI8YUQ0_9PEZI|nr:Hypothetical predicted protein [Lecanosticta acicola]